MSVTNHPDTAELHRYVTIATAVAVASLAAVAGVVFQYSVLFDVATTVYGAFDSLGHEYEMLIAAGVLWLGTALTIGTAVTSLSTVIEERGGSRRCQQFFALLAGIVAARLVGGVLLGFAAFFAIAALVPEAPTVGALEASFGYAARLTAAGPVLRANLWVYVLLHVLGLVAGVPVAWRLWPGGE